MNKDTLITYKDQFLLRYSSQSPKTIKHKELVLSLFSDHFGQDGMKITTQSIADWIDMKNLSRGTQNVYLYTVRSFIQYLNEQGISAEYPIIRKCEDTYIPYIFSKEEIERILLVADNNISKSLSADTKSFCIPMLFRILIYCGLRLNEALAIKLSDVNFENDALRIVRSTKKRKERFVVMDPSLSKILKQYVVRLSQVSPGTEYLFPQNDNQKHITKQQTEYEFQKIIRSAGIKAYRAKKYERSVCIHCFRHYFAVTSYLKLSKNKEANHIQLLSSYLGHECLLETEKYLKFSYLLSPDSEKLFEDYTAEVFEVLK